MTHFSRFFIMLHVFYKVTVVSKTYCSNHTHSNDSTDTELPVYAHNLKCCMLSGEEIKSKTEICIYTNKKTQQKKYYCLLTDVFLDKAKT